MSTARLVTLFCLLGIAHVAFSQSLKVLQPPSRTAGDTGAVAQGPCGGMTKVFVNGELEADDMVNIQMKFNYAPLKMGWCRFALGSNFEETEAFFDSHSLKIVDSSVSVDADSKKFRCGDVNSYTVSVKTLPWLCRTCVLQVKFEADDGSKMYSCSDVTLKSQVLTPCEPSCQNSGICLKGNQCLCVNSYNGTRCDIDLLPEGARIAPGTYSSPQMVGSIVGIIIGCLAGAALIWLVFFSPQKTKIQGFFVTAFTAVKDSFVSCWGRTKAIFNRDLSRSLLPRGQQNNSTVLPSVNAGAPVNVNRAGPASRASGPATRPSFPSSNNQRNAVQPGQVPPEDRPFQPSSF
eukprot:GILI01010356.1.p1 GENE.GILI01010356.1~~GILI01010356.1.p1  ORF type:complete len:368 (+),score=107.46 GILI01010356.1:62-1105(+)